MSELAIYRNFRSINLLQSRYARTGEFVVWDANLHDNAIRPFKCPEVLCEGVPATHSLYPLEQCPCFGFPGEVHPVKGFCQAQHFFIAGEQLYQASEAELCAGEQCLAGAPNPLLPVGVDTPSCSAGSCDVVPLIYVFTYVTTHLGLQVESGPSPVTFAQVQSNNTPNATITFPDPPVGFCITAIRLYRVDAKFEDAMSEMPIVGGDYALVVELPIATYSFTDTTPSCDLSYPLTTYDPKIFQAPTGLKFLTKAEDSIVVANENTVYIGMPGQPMFGTEGIVNIDDKIRCIRAIGNNILVWTDKFPTLITFSVGNAMLEIKRQTIQRKLPLSSYKSVSIWGETAYFASEYSLYKWDLGGYGGNIQSVLNEIMTPHQWKMLEPNTIVGTAYEYGYIFTTKALGHSVMLEFAGDGTDTRLGTSLMPISYINANVFGLSYEGHIIYREGTQLKQWDYREQIFCDPRELQDSDERDMCSECCPYSFRLYYDNEGKNTMRVCRVEWDERSSYEIEANFRQEHFGKTTFIETFKILSSRGFNVPKFSSSQAHSLELSGCGTITEVRFATAFSDLVKRTNQNVE